MPIVFDEVSAEVQPQHESAAQEPTPQPAAAPSPAEIRQVLNQIRERQTRLQAD